MTNPRLRAAIVAACAVMTVITGWGAVNSHVRENGWTFIIVGCVVAWSFVVAGLVAWNRRPDNRTGPLMTLVGFAWLCAGLTESPNDLSFTAGMILFLVVVILNGIAGLARGKRGRSGPR